MARTLPIPSPDEVRQIIDSGLEAAERDDFISDEEIEQRIVRSIAELTGPHESERRRTGA